MRELPEAAAGSAGLDRPIRACARGELPANAALAQAAVAAETAAEVERALASWIAALDSAGRHLESTRIRSARLMWSSAPDAWEVLRAVSDIAAGPAGGVSEAQAVADWSARFDRAAGISPTAGVALYSLGREDLLRASAGEIVRYMRACNLLGPERIGLEIGCGIGRILGPVAAELGLAVGLDISGRMLAEARRRCRGIGRLALLHVSGRDLAAFRDRAVDLVFAVDAFPYLVDAGEAVAARHVREAWRVLKAGGALLILNYSYRGDPAADRDDVASLARDAGFAVVENGTAPFAHWDGRAFLMKKDFRPG